MLQLYRMCWKNKDFPEVSKGPSLIHLDRHSGQKLKPFTKDEAITRCTHYNLHHHKDNKIRFWLEKVGEKNGN